MKRWRKRRTKLVLALLLLATLLVARIPDASQHQCAPGAARHAIVAAFVLPRLSLDCIVAVVEAIRTCASPGTGGAVACGMALVRILEVCP